MTNVSRGAAPPVATKLSEWPLSLQAVLRSRGVHSSDDLRRWVAPSVTDLGSPERVPDMPLAVQVLREAISAQKPVGLYADRDVDGLTGSAIVARSLRALGARTFCGSPAQGRGIDRNVVDRLLAQGAQVLVFIDCGSSEREVYEALAARSLPILVIDHHRCQGHPHPAVTAWIHPEAASPDSAFIEPAGCLMAFHLVRALWTSFLGTEDPGRLDYFLYDHLDLAALGLLADRSPLRGENRVIVWQGLRRLAQSRKMGLSLLNRFFRLVPRPGGALATRDVLWRIIPLLNAGGRLGRPEVTTELLLTEDMETAHRCLDTLLQLNKARRQAQDQSLDAFEKAVQEQCALDEDAVIVARSAGLEPAVTGLAAQALARKYNRPAFLFVKQGAEWVGSGRGPEEENVFAWISGHQDLLVKFGGHDGAVGLTVRETDYAVLRGRLLARRAWEGDPDAPSREVEGDVALEDLEDSWWVHLEALAPFGPGNPEPCLRLNGVSRVEEIVGPRGKKGGWRLVGPSRTLPASWEDPVNPPDLFDPQKYELIGGPDVEAKASIGPRWKIHEMRKKDP